MRTVLAVIALALASPALADPPMGGGGVTFGTNVLPAGYPSNLPKVLREGGTTIEKVRADAFFGLDGVYYFSPHGRMGIDLHGGFGKRFNDYSVMLKGHYVGPTKALQFFVGGGLGAGVSIFRGDDEERLRVSSFPVLVEGGMLIPDKWRGYQLSIWAKYNIPSRHVYRDTAGTEIDVKGGLYFTSGLSLTLFFGNFAPPKVVKPPVQHKPPTAETAPPPASVPEPTD